jgi:hypothetical protein
MKATIYATCWQDGMLGPLHLKHPTPAQAIEMAQQIAVKGAGKIWHVRAVELTPDDRLIDLIPPLNTGDTAADSHA